MRAWTVLCSEGVGIGYLLPAVGAGDDGPWLACFLQLSTESAILATSLSSLHLSQNGTVPLFGSDFGRWTRTRVGSKLASPTTSASPVSRTGSKSLNPPRLSGNKRRTTL